MAHALAANGLPALHPRSGRKIDAALDQFRCSGAAAGDAGGASGSARPAPAPAEPPRQPRVLLLLLKQGANGLNLTEAQHVVLVEPVLDPGSEAQAIGRVDRIGQHRETHVHRFLVDATIDERVPQLGRERAAAMDMRAAAGRSRGGSLDKGGLSVRCVPRPPGCLCCGQSCFGPASPTLCGGLSTRAGRWPSCCGTTAAGARLRPALLLLLMAGTRPFDGLYCLTLLCSL